MTVEVVIGAARWLAAKARTRHVPLADGDLGRQAEGGVQRVGEAHTKLQQVGVVRFRLRAYREQGVLVNACW